MRKPHVVILTCVWKRYEVLEIFVAAVMRLKKDNSVICDIDVVAVGSDEPKSQQLCEANGFHYLNTANNPLGRKWNKGLRFCKELNPNHVLIMGSDDVLSSNVMPVYLKHAAKGFDYIGIRDIYFYNAVSNMMIYWGGYTNHRRGESIGLGRFISRGVLKRFKWRLWDDHLNRALDNSMTTRLKKTGYKEHVFSAKEYDVMAMDIKGLENISKFSNYKGVKVGPAGAMKSLLPKEEVRSILALPSFYAAKSKEKAKATVITTPKVIESVSPVVMAELAAPVGKQECDAAYYNAVYSKGGYNGTYLKPALQTPFIKYWSKMLGMVGASDIVEFGCGPGQLAGLLHQNGGEYLYGLDISDVAIRMAQRTNVHIGERFLHMNAFEFDWSKVGNDVVLVMSEFVEHIEKDKEIIKAVPKGMRMVFTVPDFDHQSHLRYFNNQREIKEQYEDLIDIKSIDPVSFAENKTIYVVDATR